jgi:hypothetical protein
VVVADLGDEVERGAQRLGAMVVVGEVASAAKGARPTSANSGATGSSRR